MKEMENENKFGIYGYVIQPPVEFKTDLQFLLNFVNGIFSNDSHPLHMNLIKFSREFNSEFSMIQTDSFDSFEVSYDKAVEEVTVYLGKFL